MTKIKLSPKQKEVVKALKENTGVLKWIGTPICKFTFKGKTLRYDTAIDLKRRGIIKRDATSGYIDYSHQLTELGQSIEL